MTKKEAMKKSITEFLSSNGASTTEALREHINKEYYHGVSISEVSQLLCRHEDEFRKTGYWLLEQKRMMDMAEVEKRYDRGYASNAQAVWALCEMN